MPGKKNPIIELPLKVIFTESGINFFIQNKKKLNKFSMADNTEHYGMMLKQFSPASIQHMLMIGYIARLEVSRPEFTSKRSEIMDLSKLIVYGYLYKRLDEDVFNIMIDSDIIKNWNRVNPGNIIDRKTRLNDSVLKGIMEKNAEVLKQIKREISNPLISGIHKDESLLPDEKNIYVFLIEKLLNNIQSFTWFVLIKFQSSMQYNSLLGSVRDLVGDYLKKSRIAEFLSLMLMELNVSAENINMKGYVDKKYKGTVSYHTLMYDPEKREQLMNQMIRDNADISVAWRIGTETSHSIGTGKKLQLSIYNDEAEYFSLRDNVNEKMHTGVQNASLTDFYKSSRMGNAELGMYYLSYLLDECAKVNIKFTSHVNELPGGKTFITLTLQF